MTNLNPDQMVIAPVDDDIPELGEPRRRVAFRLQGEIFDAPQAVPALVFMEYAKKFEALQNQDASDVNLDLQFAAMTDLLKMILKPDSYERFRSRLSDPENPIELVELQKTVIYLMERYGLRPTELPSDSSSPPSSPESGTNSTAPAPAGA